MKAAAAGRPSRASLDGRIAALQSGDARQGEGGVHTRLRARRKGGATAPAASTTPRPAHAVFRGLTEVLRGLRSPEGTQSLRTAVEGYAAYALWSAIIAAGLLGAPAACLLAAWLRSPASLAVAALATAAAAVLASIPLPADDDDDAARPPAWADALCRFLVTRTLRFLRPFKDGSAGLRVVCAPGAAAALAAVVAAGRPVVLALEPHSTLPLGMVLAFSPHAQAELAPGARPPPALVGARLAASSACFAVPLVRHLWWWLGVRPADRASVRAHLARCPPGRALALCPGGVAEVALLTPPPPPPAPKTETLFLKARSGYVREALRARAALVPAFVLGQTAMLAWTKPPLLPPALLERLSRAIGFMPLWVHNGWFLPCAKRSAQLTVLVGRPVEEVEAGAGDASAASVRRGADGFVREIQGLVRELQGGVAGEERTRVVVV